MSKNKTFNTLCNISNSILDIYEKINKLDDEGLKESLEHKKYLEYLDTLLCIERKYYNNITPKEANKIKREIWFMHEKFQQKELDNIIFPIRKTLIYTRIVNHLQPIMILDKELAKKQYLINTFLKKINSNSLPPIKLLESLFRTIVKDINLILLEKIQCEIEKNDNFSDEFNSIKYYLGYVNKDIENYYLKNNFIINNNPYLYSKLFADITGINIETYDAFKNYLCEMYISEEINSLLELLWMDNKNKQYLSIERTYRKLIIESCLTITDTATITKLNEIFHEIIESNEYLEFEELGRKNEDAVIEAFTKTKRNKRKRTYVSFGISPKNPKF